jgi:hypothetical protein
MEQEKRQFCRFYRLIATCSPPFGLLTFSSPGMFGLKRCSS